MTLFPALVDGVLSESIIGRARTAGIIDVRCHDIRSFSKDKHRKTDDTPYGGGKGMVMTCQPIYDCYSHVLSTLPEGQKPHVVYMSPKGGVFNHEMARRLAEYENIVFLCGHYEGVDQRVLDLIVDEEISIGDYVLTGGEIPACIVIDAVSRLKDGVLADTVCHEDESVACGILEYPQYTKPREFMGLCVPDVLVGGDHARVDRWRLESAVEITRRCRPDLLALHPEYEEMLAPKKKRRPKHRHSSSEAQSTEPTAESTDGGNTAGDA